MAVGSVLQGSAGSYFALDRSDWVAGGAIPILSGQRVTITSGAAPGMTRLGVSPPGSCTPCSHASPGASAALCGAAQNSTGPISLDFAGMSSVIVLRSGSYLEWDSVVLRGFASKHINASLYQHYRVRQLGGWPSITADPGAQVHAAAHSLLCVCMLASPVPPVPAGRAGSHSGRLLSFIICMDPVFPSQFCTLRGADVVEERHLLLPERRLQRLGQQHQGLECVHLCGCGRHPHQQRHPVSGQEHHRQPARGQCFYLRSG